MLRFRHSEAGWRQLALSDIDVEDDRTRIEVHLVQSCPVEPAEEKILPQTTTYREPQPPAVPVDSSVTRVSVVPRVRDASMKGSSVKASSKSLFISPLAWTRTARCDASANVASLARPWGVRCGAKHSASAKLRNATRFVVGQTAQAPVAASARVAPSAVRGTRPSRIGAELSPFSRGELYEVMTAADRRPTMLGTHQDEASTAAAAVSRRARLAWRMTALMKDA